MEGTFENVLNHPIAGFVIKPYGGDAGLNIVSPSAGRITSQLTDQAGRVCCIPQDHSRTQAPVLSFRRGHREIPELAAVSGFSDGKALSDCGGNRSSIHLSICEHVEDTSGPFVCQPAPGRAQFLRLDLRRIGRRLVCRRPGSKRLPGCWERHRVMRNSRLTSRSWRLPNPKPLPGAPRVFFKCTPTVV